MASDRRLEMRRDALVALLSDLDISTYRWVGPYVGFRKRKNMVDKKTKKAMRSVIAALDGVDLVSMIDWNKVIEYMKGRGVFEFPRVTSNVKAKGRKKR